jgi:periplasmic divalent cation tolerance protein
MIILYTTLPDIESAETLAEKIIESELAFCINIIPEIQSIYKWHGKINKEKEASMIVKSNHTSAEDINKLTTFIEANHPYQEPIIVRLDRGK